jgi:putative inorganic carbon (HCO3(-)) transporter
MRNKLASQNTFQLFFQKVFLKEKLNNWLGLLIAISIAIGFGYLVPYNLIAGFGIIAAIVGISLIIISILNIEVGLYITMFYIFSTASMSRFLFKEDVPVGIGADILVCCTFLGLFFIGEKLKKNALSFFKNKPVIYYAIIVVYLTVELFNPLGHNFQGWFQVMRKVFESFLIVFIAYNAFDSLAKIRRFITILFVSSVVIAIYGCFQQWHGLLKPELDWINNDPIRFGLIYVFGDYRKFSLLVGPTDFGIIMASCAVLFIIIGLNTKRRLGQIMYLTGGIFMILGMSYSGTRTANAMMIGGIIVFVLLTINRLSSKIFAIVAIFLFLFFMYVPIYDSITLIRFRSTFSATKDASYNVRETNRQSVQPFIWAHPFGGGISTTGDMGAKYNPQHPTAGFPTDSSYLSKALETGWLGLFLTLLFYFTLLQYIIRDYFLAKNKEIKLLSSAFLAFFFAYFLGEMTQEAVGQFTNMVVFFPAFAIVLRLRQFSEEDYNLRNSTSEA